MPTLQEQYEKKANDVIVPIFGCSVRALRSVDQTHLIVSARIAAFLALKEAGFIVLHIAKAFDMDHSTVDHHLKLAEDPNSCVLAKCMLKTLREYQAARNDGRS
jgi:DNA-binding transcriptional ArsR family regulator